MASLSSLPSVLLRSICQRAVATAHLLRRPTSSHLVHRCHLSTLHQPNPALRPPSISTAAPLSSSPSPTPPSPHPTDSSLPPSSITAQPPPVVNPFAHLPRPPALLELLNAAVSRSSKHRISTSLRTPPPPSSLRRGSHNAHPRSTASSVHRRTFRIKALALAQLSAIHSSLSEPVTRWLAAFPPLSRLSGFDRAVMRLSLAGGEREYVSVLRAMRRALMALNSAHDRAVKEVNASHIQINAAQPPPVSQLTDAIFASDPPTAPASRDMDSLLSYHRRMLLHTITSAATAYLGLLGLVGSLSVVPVVRVGDGVLTVLVMGVPNVGKSSLLRAISSGKPEVQNYAFTTRGLVVGHMLLPEAEEEEEVASAEEREVENASAMPSSAPIEAESTDKGGDRRPPRRRRFAAATMDEDARAVRLHASRIAASAEAAEVEQRRRVRASYLSSLASESPSMPVQLIDTPGLLFRPDSQRKAIELLTLTSLHHLPLHLILYVLDESGSCGWNVQEQDNVRNEVRTRYAARLQSGQVGWIDVRSKSDIEEKYVGEGGGVEEEVGEWGEEEMKQRRREMEEHRRLYGVKEGEGSAKDSTTMVRVSVHDPHSIARLQREMRQQLRAQLRRMREERGEVYESIEDEFRRTFGEQPTQQSHTEADASNSHQPSQHLTA